MSLAYYNEFDPFAAAWLQQLIAAGHIAPGVVDTRSIEDVTPDELAGFTQCHFFAGIGVWSYALRQAGWRDDQPVWTGSCPCQPFSAAGKGGGFADERHLWPAFLHLIQQCGPTVVLGEQVASKDGLAWLDLVRADLEGTGRSFAAADLCAAGVGAPHIRQRSFWVAHAPHVGWREGSANGGGVGRGNSAQGRPSGSMSGRAPSGLEYPSRSRGEARLSEQTQWQERIAGVANDSGGELPRVGQRSSLGGMADAGRQQRERRQDVERPVQHGETVGSKESVHDQRRGGTLSVGRASPTDGFWRDADWLYCRDGKWRPVESGTFPLAHGATNRVGRLRGYGNAIVAPVAQAFIESVMDVLCD